MMAILGTRDKCIASNPSDQNVALAALDTMIHVTGSKGDRVIPIAQFYVLPGDTPERETVLDPGDLITHVTIPALPFGAKSLYLKLRDRFFRIRTRLGSHYREAERWAHRFHPNRMGGIGTVPWRSREAEKALHGKPATLEKFREAAEVTLRSARPQLLNGLKVDLARRCHTHALTQATAQHKEDRIQESQTQEPIRESKVIGVPTPRMDGSLKTTAQTSTRQTIIFPVWSMRGRLRQPSRAARGKCRQLGCGEDAGCSGCLHA